MSSNSAHDIEIHTMMNRHKADQLVICKAHMQLNGR